MRSLTKESTPTTGNKRILHARCVLYIPVFDGRTVLILSLSHYRTQPYTQSNIYHCILYCQDTYIHLRGPNKGLVVVDLGPSILHEIPGLSSMRLAAHRKSVPHLSVQKAHERAPTYTCHQKVERKGTEFEPRSGCHPRKLVLELHICS